MWNKILFVVLVPGSLLHGFYEGLCILPPEVLQCELLLKITNTGIVANAIECSC